MYDLIIKNGKIVDGTASPGYYADVAIKNGKIAKIARNISDGNTIINAKGLTVTPGFIDSHSHSDKNLLTHPDMTEKIEQGITTSIGGQCGSTSAPLYKGVTEENAKDVAGFGKETDVYKTFGTLIGIAKDVPLGSNNMSFVGHGAIRRAVIGMENRKATPDEMEQMKYLVREAMEAGAVGLSFGLIYTPSCYADTDELIELAMVVKEYDGMLSAHIRSENFELIAAVNEFLKVIKLTGLKAVFSHHKSTVAENWGKVSHTIRMIRSAAEEGYDVYCDVYPYIASSTSLSATIIPKEMRALDTESLTEMLKDEENRRLIKESYSSKLGDSLNHLLVTNCENHPEYNGLRISEIADLRGQDHYTAAFDILVEANTNVTICNFSMCEEDVETVLKFERAMLCTDSGVAGDRTVFHPRLKATFPRFLGRYVRERGVVSLEEAIRKITSMPAMVYGLPTKGLIREGFDADICIFDSDKITDKSEFNNCNVRCEGLNYVILGGEVVVEDAVHNGKKMGKFITRQR